MTTEREPAPFSPLPWREGEPADSIVCDADLFPKGDVEELDHRACYGGRLVCDSMNPSDRAFVLSKVNPPADEPESGDLLARFVALEKRRRGLEAELDATKKETIGVAELLLDEWADRGQQNARVGDLTVFVAHDFYCNKQTGVSTDDVCTILYITGLGHLVAPNYSAASLKSWVREQLGADSDLPAQLDAVLSHGETTRLKTRRA